MKNKPYKPTLKICSAVKFRSGKTPETNSPHTPHQQADKPIKSVTDHPQSQKSTKKNRHSLKKKMPAPKNRITN